MSLRRWWRLGVEVPVKLAAIGLATSALLLSALTAWPSATAAAAGYNSALTRYPYLTDVTTDSVRVTWADTYRNTYGAVTYGAAGTCTTSTTKASALGTSFTIINTAEYQHSVTISGLTQGASYCYRVLGGSSANVDLLGSDASPIFKALPTSGSYSFLTFGDWGDTAAGFNTNQAALDALMAKSGASFAVSTGDIAYNNGSQVNYGDLVNSGTSTSEVFGPSYWTQPGAVLPFFSTPGNHGRTVTFFQNWPEPTSTSEAGESYRIVSYPASTDGSSATTGPGAWYAFDVEGVRYYVLTADWSDTNTGNATGSLCLTQFTTHSCPDYQTDAEIHWKSGDPEYDWLASDLRAHAAEKVKMAFFHYPLRSDDATESSDIYLQNSAANPDAATSLEKLLFDHGVKLVFNGHAHMYQRNIAPPGAVTSYVTGGGGAPLVPIAKSSTTFCATTDAYGLGWSPTSSSGSYCGDASTKPANASEVYHFLRVTVSGTNVTVTPTNAAGATFDSQTYNFGDDSTPPLPPGNVQARFVTGSKPYAAVTWSPGSDSGSGVAAYDIYRQSPVDQARTYLATVAPDKTAFNDPTATAGVAYVYSVDSRDQAGNATTGGPAPIGGGGDTTAPSVPSNVTATAVSPGEIDVQWTPSTDSVGVTAYKIYRDGTAVGTVTGGTTMYQDTGLATATTYTYAVTALDGVGNESVKSANASATTTGGGGITAAGTLTDDATISKASGTTTTNYGHASTLTVDADGGVNDFLLNFSVPPQCTPTSATLTLTVGGGSTSGSSHGGSFYAAPPGSSWTEGSVTGQNAPALSGSPVSLGPVAAGTTYSIDVTPLLRSGLVGGVLSLRASTTSNDAAAFVSKDAINGPTAGPHLALTCGA